MAAKNVNDIILKYENYINNILREDLRDVEERLMHTNNEISDLIQQRHTIKVITDKKIHPEGFKTQLNIGCNFFMEASVPDTSTLLMNIGLNHFLEFKVEEACKYIDLRIKAYEKKAKELQDAAAETKAHIKIILLGITEIQSHAISGNLV